MFPYLNTEEVIIEVQAENCRVDIANLVALLELVGFLIIFFFIYDISYWSEFGPLTFQNSKIVIFGGY